MFGFPKISMHHRRRVPRIVSRSASRVAIGLALFANVASAQIATDGSLGPVVRLGGSDVVIPENLGTRAGRNIFHSFSDFNVQRGGSATFTAVRGMQTSNIIGRVTGNTASNIEGALRSSVPGAALWLMNPNGVFFGPGSSLDVQGGVYITSSDYLGFADGGRFAVTDEPTATSLLSSATPAAFGFSSASSGIIVVDGAELVAPGISFTASGVGINNGATLGRDPLTSVVLPSPQSVHLAAVDSIGELSVPGGDAQSTIEAYGIIGLFAGNVYGSDIRIEGGRVGILDSTLLSYETAQDAGDLSILGEDITIETSRLGAGDVIYVDFGSGFDRRIAAVEGGDLSVAGNAVMPGGAASRILALESNFYSYTDDAHAGTTLLRADSIDIQDNGSDVFVGVLGEGTIVTETETGRANDIVLQGNNININLADVYSNPSRLGQGGDIRMEGLSGDGSLPVAETIALELDVTIGSPLARFQTFGSFGEQGSIELRARNIFLTNAQLRNIAVDGNTTSQTRISGDRILLNSAERYGALFGGSDASGFRAPSVIGASVVGDGRAADVFIEGAASTRERPVPAATVEIYGSIISSSALGPVLGGTGNGDAGDVTVRSRSVLMGPSPVDSILPSRIGAPAASGADRPADSTSGNVNIFADQLLMVDSLGGLEIITLTSGLGDAGDITIAGSSSTMENLLPAESVAFSGVNITSSSFSEGPDSGAAGDITIVVQELFATAGAIDSATRDGEGGDIRLFVDSLGLGDRFGIESAGAPDVITAASSGQGTAGDILIAGNDSREGHLSPARELYLVGDIRASGSDAGGAAGSVTIVSDQVYIGNSGSISTDNSNGPAGNITIHTDLLSNNSERLFDRGSAITSITSGSADAGLISLLELTDNGGRIDLTRTGDPDSGTLGPVVSSASFGSGAAGSIRVNMDRINLLDSTFSVESSDIGGSGNILVDTRNLALDNSLIEARAQNSAGGSVSVRASELVSLRDSTIRASAQSLAGEDAGGNVTITGPDFIVLQRSRLQADANAGAGGNIAISTGALIQSGDSFITATSRSNVDGQVTVDAIDNITGSIVDVEAPTGEVPELSTARCTPQEVLNRGSLIIESLFPLALGSSQTSGDLGQSPAGPSGCRRPAP